MILMATSIPLHFRMEKGDIYNFNRNNKVSLSGELLLNLNTCTINNLRNLSVSLAFSCNPADSLA